EAGRCRRPASKTRARPGAGAAHRLGLGVPAGYAARCGLHLQARAGAGRRLRLAAQSAEAAIARQDRQGDLTERLPQTDDTEPELLAHHYTEAKQPDKAIPLWQKAGSLALGRMALVEPIAHLNKGLELVAALPPSAERD